MKDKRVPVLCARNKGATQLTPQPVPRALSAKSNPTSSAVDDTWKYEPVGSPEVIETLADAYHRIIYPM